MKLEDSLPKMRAVEIVPLHEGREESFLLRDPLQLSDEALTVSHSVLFCLQFFDGTLQVAALAAAWKEAADGNELPLGQVKKIVNELDRVFLLDNERSYEKLLKIKTEFLREPLRAYRFSDGGFLDDCYRAALLPSPSQIPNERNDLGVLVAPHIDYERGASAWGLAYSTAKQRFGGDVVIVLGVNHQPHATAATLTRKDFDTPFGTVKADGELVDEIAAALPFDAFEDEFCHRDEHSIELAATALKHAYGDACPRIVPILCGSFEEFVVRQTSPVETEAVVAVQEALLAVVERLGERVLLLASVDLAHIGPQFGWAKPIEETQMRESLDRDRELLNKVNEGDAEAFFEMLVAEGNRRNVCGTAPLYHALSVRPGSGSMGDASLHYWRADDDTGAVSFGVAGRLR